ncbi:MAG: ROK family protein [Bacteroidales bacterium]|nr:ROK family protein [Bacteroidales bacterium]
MDSKTILLDVGGTFIKCSDGREIPIDSAGPRESIIASLRQAVDGYDAAVVAIPGPFRYSDGTFLMKHKFASVYGEKFQDLVCHSERQRRISCRFIHDVNAMLLGELGKCREDGYKRVALATLGTGLGFSVSVDGVIRTGELGSPKDGIWDCPYKDGILEDYVSKRGFLRGYTGITVKDLAGMARGGDAAAAARFRECGTILGTAIAPVLEKLGVECLLLGGQISRSFDLFGGALKESLAGVRSLKCIRPVSDISNATFNGLRSLCTN